MKTEGIARNPSEAAKYYKMAADQGDSSDQWRYGDLLAEIRNLFEAAKVLHGNTETFAKRFPRISGNTEIFWRYGIQASMEIRKSKRQWKYGNPYSQWKYGNLLAEGEGIARNLIEAAKYYKMAADQGDSCAQWQYDSLLPRIGAARKSSPS
jgi:TPR repeat protein